MEATHLAKPFGLKHAPIEKNIMEEYDHPFWVVESNGMLSVSGGNTSCKDSAIKAWNKFFSKAPRGQV